MAIAGMTQPLAQRCERNGSIVSKETVVETVRSNLAELRARRNDEHGLSGGVTRPSEPGPTVEANEAAHHQADADAASARGPSSSDPTMAGIDWSDLDHGLATLITGTTTMMSTKTIMMPSGTTKRPGARVQLQLLQQQLAKIRYIPTSPIFCSGSFTPPKAIHVGDQSPDEHADPTADDRADSTADDRAVAADNRADSTANGRADSTADDRADSTADDHPVSAADERADPLPTTMPTPPPTTVPTPMPTTVPTPVPTIVPIPLPTRRSVPILLNGVSQRTTAQAPTCQSSRRPTRHLTATPLPSSYPR